MLLAGIEVRLELVEWLRMLVDEPTASVLGERSTTTSVVKLTVEDRERILLVLDDPPGGLEPLRATLLDEHVARKRDRLPQLVRGNHPIGHPNPSDPTTDLAERLGQYARRRIGSEARWETRGRSP